MNKQGFINPGSTLRQPFWLPLSRERWAGAVGGSLRHSRLDSLNLVEGKDATPSVGDHCDGPR